MVNTIVFDFGDVFINKEKDKKKKAFEDLGLSNWNEELDKLEGKLETGKVTEEQFLKGIQKHVPGASLEQIKDAWNCAMGEFPLERLEFLQKLKENYRLFLLSNTDPLHIEKFEQDHGASFYSDFYQCFENIYFSHEIGIRKPHDEVYNYLINKHEIQPKRTLFVDDKKFNTDAAEALGFKVWQIRVGEDDVVEMFDKKIIT